MRALRLEKNTLSLLSDYPTPSISSGYALVQIYHAALNRRDQWIVDGAYPNIKDSTLGSDGCGIVVAGDTPLLEKRVILCPSINWGDREAFQSKSYNILGMPTEGTFADYCMIPIENLQPSPSHLTSAEAAALPLAGLTAWRAVMTKAQLSPKENILITGIGGGVSLFALQIALAHNAHVWVTSSSDTKIERATKMGAKGGSNYTVSDWYKEVPHTFDVIIDGAGGHGFGNLIRLLGMGGRLIFYGGTRGSWPKISPQHLFFKQASLMGSTMGSPQEFQQLCLFVEKHNIRPVIEDTVPIEKYRAAFSTLLSPQKMGKIILSFR